METEGEEAVDKTVDSRIGSSKQTTEEGSRRISHRISDASSRAIQRVDEPRKDKQENLGRELDERIRSKERTGSGSKESQEKDFFDLKLEQALLQLHFTMSNSKIDFSQKTFEKSGAKMEELKTLQTIAISDQSFQATCDHADLKKEEANTQVQCGDSNVRINPNHNNMSLKYNWKATTPVYIPPASTKMVFREALCLSAIMCPNVDIYVQARNNGSTEMTIPRVAKFQFEPSAVEEMKTSTASSSSDDIETIKTCVEEQINYLSNSDGATSFDPGYVGDDESTHDVNGNLNKVLRKKFGHYPDYRTRLNGVTWRTGYSSDDDDHRGSDRKSRKSSVGRVSENLKTRNGNSSDPGSDEENNEPVTIHVIASKKIKAFKKRVIYPEVVDTTGSEASDVESLTDCSLCCGDSSA